ncbi:hypothetical protein B0H14DRAFT_3011661 [Mycena olivaceomarginata]|nr:hypothetical protein B0H14DRAFT_3011661 [Mycena olivaceomarginata]
MLTTRPRPTIHTFLPICISASAFGCTDSLIMTEKNTLACTSIRKLHCLSPYFLLYLAFNTKCQPLMYRSDVVRHL